MKKLLVVISFLTLFMVAHATVKEVAVDYHAAERVSPENDRMFSEVYKVDDPYIYLSAKDVVIDKYLVERTTFGLQNTTIEDSIFISAGIRLDELNTVKAIDFLVVSSKTGVFRQPIVLWGKKLSPGRKPVPEDLLLILQEQYDNILYWIANLKTDLDSFSILLPHKERFLHVTYILIPKTTHEFTEAYKGGLISQRTRVSSPAANNKGTVQKNTSMYKIDQIISNDIFHTIYAERNDSLFMIISPMVFDKPHDSQEIKAGETYPLNLRQIYPKNDTILGTAIMPIVPDFNAYGIDIPISNKYHNHVYKASNLKGIYFTK